MFSVRVGEQAAHHQRGRQDDHEDALLEGGGDDGVHERRQSGRVARRGRQSRVAARSMNSVPLATTVSPTCRPLRTSTRPLVVAPTSIGA